MGDVQAGMELPRRRDPDPLSEFELEEVATCVEERFTRIYDPQGMASPMHYRKVSAGWWLGIKRLGLTLWIGTDKPAIESGDLLRISISKVTRE